MVPHLVQRGVEDAVGDFCRDIVEAGASQRDGEGVYLEVRTPQELDIPDTVVVEARLVLGDHVGRYGGEGLRVVAQLRPDGLGVTEGRRAGRGKKRGRGRRSRCPSGVLCRRSALVDAREAGRCKACNR